ncbi:MAG: phosphotransferase [Deltaproteobacteria bacterium]
MSNTEYVILHGWQSLPDHHDSDLDIAINPQHLDILEESLFGFKSGKLVQMLQHESSCFYFVLAHKNGNGTEFLQVDAATDYRRNGLTYFSAETLNSERKKWKGFWVAAPQTELAYLLVKKTLKGETPEHQKRRLRYLIDEIGEKRSVEIATELFGSEFGPELITWISEDNWNAQESNLPKLKRSLMLRTVKKDPLNPLKYWFNEAKRIMGRWLSPTGLFVAVLGPDGAGKSTLIEKLEKDLSGAFRRTANFHLKPDLLGKKPGNAPVTDPHGKPSRSFLLSTLKIAYYVADYGLGYVLKLYPKLAKSTMVIFDRYYDDLMVDPLRYRYGGSPWIAGLGRYLVPRPDLFFVLDASEDELLKRKQEVEKGELTRQRSAYVDMAAKLSNAYILDSSRSPEKLTCDASDIITSYLHERYQKRRALYFANNERNKTFEWLTSVLSADPRKYRFALKDTASKDESADLKTYCEFNYLPVRDGRGYLLPQSRIAALNGLMLYNAQTQKAKALKALIGTSRTCGLGNLFMKSVRIVSSGDLSTKDAGDPILFEYLKKHTKLEDPEFAISLGTPGPNRKPVIQINSRTGLIAGYAKAGWNEATNSLVKNEADTIKNLSLASFNSFDIPRVLHSGVWRGRYVTILSSPEGNLLSAPRTLNAEYVNAVDELADFNLNRMPVLESPFWAGFTGRVKNIESEYYRSILEEKAIPAIERALGATQLPFHISHGDFAPWNAFVRDGRLFLYDWEYSREDTPAGWDLFHFIFQTNVLLEKKRADELYKVIFSDTHHSVTRWYWEKLDIDEDTVKALFLLYVFEKLSLEASGEMGNLQKLNQLSKIVFLLLNDRAGKF